MKKIHWLKIGIILSFLILTVNELGNDIYKGFSDALNNTNEGIDKPNRHIDVLLDANTLGNKIGSSYKVDSLRSLHDIKIIASLSTNDRGVPFYLGALNFCLCIIFLYLTIGTLRRIYKVITAISNNQMFEQQVVNHIKRIGYYFLAGFVVVAIFDKVIIAQNIIMAGPKLHPIRTVDWPFGLLVSGFLVLLIAQAFEQGKKLQQEQELTI